MLREIKTCNMGVALEDATPSSGVAMARELVGGVDKNLEGRDCNGSPQQRKK